MAGVSAEVGRWPPAHISAVQKTFLFHQDCVKILSAKCCVAAKGISGQPFTWTWQSAFCTGESWDLPKLTGISASGFSRSLPCKQQACTHMHVYTCTNESFCMSRSLLQDRTRYKTRLDIRTTFTMCCWVFVEFVIKEGCTVNNHTSNAQGISSKLGIGPALKRPNMV